MLGKFKLCFLNFVEFFAPNIFEIFSGCGTHRYEGPTVLLTIIIIIALVSIQALQPETVSLVEAVI